MSVNSQDGRGTYTAASVDRLAPLRTNPKVSRAGIHQDVEITGRSANLNSRDIARIVGLVVKPE